MKLYYSDTLMPRVACAVARHVGAPVELVPVNLARGAQNQPEFLALNPNAKVPVLVDGEQHIWETDAIACYLARRFAPALWPEDQVHEMVRWLSWNARHFTQAGGVLYFEYIIKGKYLRQEPSPRVVEMALGNFRKFAGVLDAHLHDRDFVLGPSITVADFAVATALPFAADAHLPLADFASVARWYERIAALPAWQRPYDPI